MATTQELLSKAQRQAQELKASFEQFRSNQVPVNVMEQPKKPLDLSSPSLSDQEALASATVPETTHVLTESQKAFALEQEKEKQTQGSIAEALGILSGRGGERLRLESKMVDPAVQQQQKFESLAGIGAAELDRFDDTTPFEQQKFLEEMGGRDVTKGVGQAKLNVFNRERALKRIGMAAEVRTNLAKAEYLRGNVELANKQVERALELQYAPVEASLELLAKNLQTQIDRTDTANKRVYEEKLAEVQQQRADEADAKELSLLAAKTGTATSEELDALTGAGFSSEEKLQTALSIINRGASLENAARARRSLASEGTVSQTVGNLMASPDLGSEVDPLISVLNATAGGRALTQSETEPLTNARRVVGQLDSIIASITESDTGPLLGIIKSNNPYDVKTRELEASLIALVPQLARGIYGEVGVLTDSDVERYVRTLPNIRSTEGVNKAVAALTLRNVRSAFVGQLEAMAAAGRDVSGFVGIYQQMNNQIGQLESELGINESYDQELDEEYQQFQRNTEQESRGLWDSIAGFLFGE